MFSPRLIADKWRERADLIDDAVPMRLDLVRRISRRANVTSFSSGPDGQIIVVSTDADVRRRQQVEVTEELREIQQDGWPLLVECFWPDRSIQPVLPAQISPNPRVQPLPDGQQLVVTSRIDRSDPKPNATILDADGSLLKSFIVGDDVTSMKTTRSGDIWVSFGDEAMDGFFGEAGGLGKWTAEGDKVWPDAEDDSHRLGYGWVSGFTLADDGIWILGVVNVDGGGVVSRRQRSMRPNFGSKVCAVAGPWAARVHDTAPFFVDLVNFEDPDQPSRIVALATPHSWLLPQNTPVDAHGDTLHYLVEDEWLKVTVEQLLSAVKSHRHRPRRYWPQTWTDPNLEES